MVINTCRVTFIWNQGSGGLFPRLKHHGLGKEVVKSLAHITSYDTSKAVEEGAQKAIRLWGFVLMHASNLLPLFPPL